MADNSMIPNARGRKNTSANDHGTELAEIAQSRTPLQLRTGLGDKAANTTTPQSNGGGCVRVF